MHYFREKVIEGKRQKWVNDFFSFLKLIIARPTTSLANEKYWPSLNKEKPATPDYTEANMQDDPNDPYQCYD